METSKLPKHLEKVGIKRHADRNPEKPGKIKTLKKSNYCVIGGFSITGEAPKSFIRVYEYQAHGKCKKNNKNTWTLYIAKTGHKFYPLESITEFLIARIGETLGLDMAYSRLVYDGTQVRFLSRYFLDPGTQELVHGSNILSQYLNDRTFVLDIEEKRLEKEFFTLEETIKAIEVCFPEDSPLILEKFFLMLFFDAWVGVQDRHCSNWGIVRHIDNKHRPYFSPIYDSARGLFWNDYEKNLLKYKQNNQLDQLIEKRMKNSQPQFCLLNKSNINHFELVQHVWENGLIKNPSYFRQIFSHDSLNAVKKMVIKDFFSLLGRDRVELILQCLTKRHEKIDSILT